MKLKTASKISLLSLLPLISCGEKPIDVQVTNSTGAELGVKIMELPASQILKRLKSKAFYITNEKGEEIPSQLSYDSLILFPAEIAVNETQLFKIHPSDTLHKYPSTVWGDLYPKRRDDLSYENELVGFRIYGPGTQQAGERAYGYDIFFKYPTEELIVPHLYSLQTDDSNWTKADSLRKIDNTLAEEFINSFSYHIDHGKGMDCYAVGHTLGDGVTAILEKDSILYPWCYQSAEILDNGPIRFTASLKFPMTSLDSTSKIIENRIISLDSYSFLNRCKVWFEGMNREVDLVTGFPLRDESKTVVNLTDGILAYADPTQGENNGRALLGIKTATRPDSSLEKDNHVLLVSHLSPSEKFEYKWGFSWDKTEIPTMEEWVEYLEKADMNYSVTIK